MARASADGHGEHRPVLESILPNGPTYPANAALVLRGHRLTPVGLSATIDGVPATLVLDPSISNIEPVIDEDYRTLVLRLDPTPEIGQHVALFGEPCADPEYNTCDPIDVQYVAGPPDVTPPPAIGLHPFDLERILPGLWGCDCCFYGSWLHARLAPPDDLLSDETAVFYEITVEHAIADLGERVHDLADVVIQYPDQLLGVLALGEDFPIEGWCMTVRTIDAAGNAGAPTTTCDACMWQEHEPGVIFVEWHAVPGGPCDVEPETGTETGATPTTGLEPTDLTTEASDGAATAGEDPLVPHGCACEHHSPGSALGWLLMTLALARRARDRQRPGVDET